LLRLADAHHRTQELGVKFCDALAHKSAAAKGSLAGAEREKRLALLAEQLEVSLELASITAVEVRLQEGVTQTVASVRRAGASFWMLTGDKTGAAIAIARSRHLITEELDLVYATAEAFAARSGSSEPLHSWLANAAVVRRRAGQALILDGTVFRAACETEQGRQAVHQLSLVCRVGVGCRLSRMQKQRLIELFRQLGKPAVTLAIGDGANDGPMIIAAHVGVGVRGKEGRQPVQASDGQFDMPTSEQTFSGRQGCWPGSQASVGT